MSSLRLPDVGEGAVPLDEAAGVGESALVGAVHLVGVEDPVRVHRHRGLAACCGSGRPRCRRLRLRSAARASSPAPSGVAEAGRVAPVAVGREAWSCPYRARPSSGRGWVGTMFQRHLLGRDPVLAGRPALDAPERRRPPARLSGADPAAATRGGTSTRAASCATSAWPWSSATCWPASVQKTRPPPARRREAAAVHRVAAPPAPAHLLTVTSSSSPSDGSCR